MTNVSQDYVYAPGLGLNVKFSLIEQHCATDQPNEPNIQWEFCEYIYIIQAR